MRWKIRCGGGRATGIQPTQRWYDIDDDVHTCDAYVYFEDAGLSPPGAQHNLIDRVKASVISSGNSAELWRERLPWWFIALQKESQQGNCVR